jgi:hypothetical protein
MNKKLFTPKLQPMRRHFGATTVEFALSATFLFTLMFGIVDMSRWLYAINSAVEATRSGARIAAVCAPNAAGIKVGMLTQLPANTTASMIDLTYPNDSCPAGEICMVRVKLIGVPFEPVTWILPSPITLPTLQTTVPRESLATTIGGSTNPDC